MNKIIQKSKAESLDVVNERLVWYRECKYCNRVAALLIVVGNEGRNLTAYNFKFWVRFSCIIKKLIK